MNLCNKKKRMFVTRFVAFLLAASMTAGSVPARVSQAEESGVKQTVYNGVTYSYKELTSHENSVEITGVIVPDNSTVLEIPENLDGKSVISLDLGLDGDVVPDQEKAEVGIKKLVLPKSIRSPESATNGGEVKYLDLWHLFKLESIEVAEGNKYLKAKDGVLYNADMSIMLEYPVCKKDTAYKMPSSVTFSTGINNDYLKKLTFSSNKEYTDAYISWCENLESVYFPDNIKWVSGFYGAHKLKTIRWSKNLLAIGERAFENAISLKKVKLPGKVRMIGAGAFRWCTSLEDVVLPDSVAYVGSSAFARAPGMDLTKASYLLSPKNKKIKGRIPDYYRYVAVATLTKGKKHKYYDSQDVHTLKPSEKKIRINAGKSKMVSISSGISTATSSAFMKGWKLKTDILSFTSSNPKVAKVTSKGKIKGLKKGKAVITVRMKTSDEKCRIKVTVA